MACDLTSRRRAQLSTQVRTSQVLCLVAGFRLNEEQFESLDKIAAQIALQIDLGLDCVAGKGMIAAQA